ncbi:MAG: hypothetical protein JWM33_1826, partial [Caulobacteraceae bacterium]|nr:hypothetical protein [Caulobacteraceae bacterium]
TLWILGTPPAISGGPGTRPFRWDTAVFRRRLKGANAFLAPVALPATIGGEPRSPFQVNADCSFLPPTLRATVRPDDPTTVCVGPNHQLGVAKMITPDDAPPGYRVEDLPEQQQADLQALTAPYTRPPYSAQKPQGRWSIVFAARQLTDSLSAAVGLQGGELTDQLGQAAKAAGVPAKALSVDFTAAKEAYMNGPPERQRDCLLTVMNQVRAGTASIAKGLEAWARGDLPNAFAQVGCLEDKLAIYDQVAKATTPVLKTYMAQPGTSVAAVELMPLLMKGGVIEQLKAAGYSVAGPDVDGGQ